MSNYFLRYLLPFLAPFIAYFTWVWLMQKFGAERDWKHPWHWLFVAGTVCLLTALGFFAELGGAPAGSTYVPPALKDGRIVPGHHLPPK
jgi:drug/metabolite transporter (DMT)-like permease